MGTEQKVAVITGASQGIGAALVKAYRDRNYRVVATARSIKPSNDDDVLSVAGNIADPKTAERVIAEAMARFGRIDTLVNNAGIFNAKPFTQYTEADFADALAVNLAGFFRITQLAIAEMEKQGSGHVVQVTTSLVDHAIDGVPSVLASLTKGGLNAATKSLAIEYAKRGIRVNAVSPGVIKTPMHPAETHAALGALHPVGHMGEIKDIVDAILYLEGAGFVTEKFCTSTAARAPAIEPSVPERGHAALAPTPDQGEPSCLSSRSGDPRGHQAGRNQRHIRGESRADQGHERTAARRPGQAARFDLRPHRGSRHRIGAGAACPRSNIGRSARGRQAKAKARRLPVARSAKLTQTLDIAGE
jgi:NAD(P)-dependent dehydrogenase (short-subunit alcohol dehydrogenase family)